MQLKIKVLKKMFKLNNKIIYKLNKATSLNKNLKDLDQGLL